MTTLDAAGIDDRAERDDGDVDDAFRSLLEGLRTSLPGVQVLFAFLLIVPLQSSFDSLDTLQRSLFVTAFASSAISSVLLIAPSIHQRVRAPASGVARRSGRHLAMATHITIVGSVGMGIALISTTAFVTRLVYDSAFVLLGSGVVAAVIGWSWFYLPMVSFSDSDSSD